MTTGSYEDQEQYINHLFSWKDVITKTNTKQVNYKKIRQMLCNSWMFLRGTKKIPTGIPSVQNSYS